MKGYLLLRDNKQTGPYSMEEIIEKGFKPYDLIWAEGKSAGWRYPGELPEFTTYAPMVEEQPFDRFFKKPSASSEKGLKPATEILTTASPVFKESVPVNASSQKLIEVPIDRIAEPVTDIIERIVEAPAQARIVKLESRKIFVTLPGSPSSSIPLSNKIEINEEIPAFTEPVQKKPVAEKEKPFEERKSSLANHSSYSSFQQTAHFIQDRLQPEAIEERFFGQKSSKKNSPKNIFMGAVAACLLLGGVIIGLLISNGKQSEQQQQLATLVNQIKDRENSKRQKAELSTVPITDQSNELKTQTIPENIADQKIVQGKNDKISSVDITKTEKKEVVNIISAVQKDKTAEPNLSEPEKTSTLLKSEPISESLRKTIFSLISVEGSTFKTGVLGGISNLHLTVSNNSQYPLDEIEILVNYHNIEKRI
ncbi:MAG: hypothetical protein ACKVOW_02860, partial [Chitinophagaceae bacterium]